MDGKSSLKDFLDVSEVKNCYPAGRLDYDSEGLMLLTDDGSLQQRIAHPNFKLEKYYWVQVEGTPSPHDLQLLKDGVRLKDGMCKPAKVKIIKEPKLWQRNPPIRERANDLTSWLEIIITEGRNRQVRRMCAEIGFPCLRLVRAQVGHWKLDDLEPGDYRVENVNLPEKKTGKSAKHKR